MNPTRKRRLWYVIALLVAAGIATALIVTALGRNATYLYLPSEVLDGRAGDAVTSGQARFRIGGMVAGGSFTRAPGSMEAHFRVDDGDAQLPVVYTGILPDLFREKQAVVATGRMRNGTFVAEEVLAKHDEAYMPKEVADKMGKQHRKYDVDTNPADASVPAEGAH
jgi:cytochrome c-type biogenesis protein CcmE